jgi:hypothetical protein
MGLRPTPARGGEPVFPGGWADGDGMEYQDEACYAAMRVVRSSAGVLPVPWPVIYLPPCPG